MFERPFAWLRASTRNDGRLIAKNNEPKTANNKILQRFYILKTFYKHNFDSIDFYFISEVLSEKVLSFFGVGGRFCR